MTQKPPHHSALPVRGQASVECYFGPVYHYLYREFLLPEAQSEAEVEFLLDALQPKAGERWLDVPCGYGRHLLPWQRLAPQTQLCGLELQDHFLHEAGLGRDQHVAVGDMRSLPYADASFDGILNLFNSFGYYPTPKGCRAGSKPDDLWILREWARVLRSGGRLVLDLSNRRALLQAIREQSVMQYWCEDYEVIEEFDWDAKAECLINRSRYRWPGGDDERTYRLRVYTPAQLRQLLARAGFSWESAWGDFEDEPFDSYESERMLVVARKTKV